MPVSVMLDRSQAARRGSLLLQIAGDPEVAIGARLALSAATAA
jgi:hypothetical protein